MNCEHYTEAIGELIDGTIDSTAGADLEGHLAVCVSCRALVADLREIRAATSRLPVRHPPERVWQHLSARLPQVMAEGQRERESGGLRRWRTALPKPSRWYVAGGGVALAAAATLVIALLLPGRQPAPSTDAARQQSAKGQASAVHASPGDLVQSVDAELQAAEQHYQKAIGGLEQLARNGEGSLDPELAKTLRANLTVVDRAIAESRGALQSHPTNQLARESLFDGFRRKVGLLQDTVALINQMRQGNQAEAAKILGDMNKS